MSKRVSYSLLDPWLTFPLKNLYSVKGLPSFIPPECIVLAGHFFALVGAIGFFFSTSYWWGGLLAAFGVALNHWADVWDGTHARNTNQCRNGGELLDHFLGQNESEVLSSYVKSFVGTSYRALVTPFSSR